MAFGLLLIGVLYFCNYFIYYYFFNYFYYL